MSRTMEGVREYNEGYEVYLDEVKGRPVIKAVNECGFNCTMVDLLEVLEWAKANGIGVDKECTGGTK